MLRQVRLMLEMIRYSHTVFALPFALSSAPARLATLVPVSMA